MADSQVAMIPAAFAAFNSALLAPVAVLVESILKTIFNRLQVSSQGRLFSLFLDVPELPANEDFGTDPLIALREFASTAD